MSEDVSSQTTPDDVEPPAPLVADDVEVARDRARSAAGSIRPSV